MIKDYIFFVLIVFYNGQDILLWREYVVVVELEFEFRFVNLKFVLFVFYQIVLKDFRGVKVFLEVEFLVNQSSLVKVKWLFVDNVVR